MKRFFIPWDCFLIGSWDIIGIMKNSEIKTLIFDMDGVIVDSEPIHKWAEVETCREFGMEVSDKEWDGFRGKKLEDIFSYASEKYGTGNEPIEKMIERKINIYLSRALKDLQLISGAYEFLKEQKNNRRYRLALTTSGRKNQQEKILSKFNLLEFFEVIVTSEDVRRGKPHPDPYIVTTEKLNERPENCLVIEDSDNGIISAKGAGCWTCGIITTFSRDRLESSGANIVVSNFQELSKILLKD